MWSKRLPGWSIQSSFLHLERKERAAVRPALRAIRVRGGEDGHHEEDRACIKSVEGISFACWMEMGRTPRHTWEPLPSTSIQKAEPRETEDSTKLAPPCTRLKCLMLTLRANAAPVMPPRSWKTVCMRALGGRDVLYLST